jgi:hypothetical protein
MTPYQTQTGKLSGSSYAEVRINASLILKQIQKKTKRKPYIRSAFFNKQKVFFDYFWPHLIQKSFKERIKRLKYLNCAIDLIKNSRNEPVSFENPMHRSEILHRFAGLTKNKELFYVQIKEDKKTNKKYFMSVFPA